MTKYQIRKFIRGLLLDKPRKKWEATAKAWDRAIWLGWGAVVWATAMFTGNAGVILFLIFMVVLAIGLVYFLSKGR